MRAALKCLPILFGIGLFMATSSGCSSSSGGCGDLCNQIQHTKDIQAQCEETMSCPPDQSIVVVNGACICH